MIRVNREGLKEKISSSGNEVECPLCKCNFSFKEGDIETIVEGIPYDKGIKRLLGQNKAHMVYKYVTCPWCKGKIQLKYTVM